MTRPHRILQAAVLATLLLCLPVAACADTGPAEGQPLAPAEPPPGLAFATFAGGCFWCMEPPFDKLDGVLSTISGYTGGVEKNPTYEQVSMGQTGHAEVVRVVYDPKKVGYDELIEVFWRNIDPTVENRQFCDRGRQYRTAVFYHDEEQKRLAEVSKQRIESAGRLPGPIVTEIVKAGHFYPAEDYHQDFYLNNWRRYTVYRQGCGRDQRLEELWGESPH